MNIEFSEKISTQLSAALLATPEELSRSAELSAGYDSSSKSWEVIVKYIGNIDDILLLYPSVTIIRLLGNYAVLIISERLVNDVALLPQIIYMEKPRQFHYDVYQGQQAACILPVSASPDGLSGDGVLVGIVDSGITYSHPDFSSDGISRIEFLWDQTLQKQSDDENDTELPFGRVFNKSTITQAINTDSAAEMYSICPSIDVSGHGTHVAGIAAGNGNASNGAYRGVAYESQLIIVKLATSGGISFPTTTQIMLAVDFCIQKSLELDMPISINLSFGTNSGSHSGTSLLETYLDFVAENYRCSISVGAGNDGAGYSHSGGSSFPASAEFTVGAYEPSLSLFLWKKYWDEIRIQLISPAGYSIYIPDTVSNAGKGFSYRFSLGNTSIYITGGGPSPYSPFQEIFLELSSSNSQYVESGIWQLVMSPISIKDGTWDIWLPSLSLRNSQTAFVYPSPEITLTIPSTAMNVITVGAYDSRTNRTVAFSGRGNTWAFNLQKPDIVAPGVDIISCSSTGEYTSKTGTSMAAPFVCGSAALLMQWGIVLGNDIYMYGDKLKAALIKGARQNLFAQNYPNPITGWGTLCLSDSIP